MVKRGLTDFERTDGEVELARQARVDPDLQDLPADWYKSARLEVGPPVPPTVGGQRLVTIRLDPGILEFFEAKGPDWQTDVNAVLRAFVTGHQRTGR